MVILRLRQYLAVGLLGLSVVAGGACGAAVDSVPDADPIQEVETASLPGVGVTVQPARADWDTGYFQEAVYRKALEELGYSVLEPRELTPEEFYASVADGDVAYWVNGWFPTHRLFEPLFEGRASVAGTVVAFGAIQGYLIDRAAAEEFNIVSLDDFRRPEVRDAFDIDGNGKADLFACPDGWGCNGVIGFHLDEFDLHDFIDERTGPYDESMNEAIARFEAGEHIFFYTWTPNWTVSRFRLDEDVVWIEVPNAAYPEDIELASLTVPGVQGCVKDPCLMGFPANDINVVANDVFLNANPAAARLFEVAAIPLSDIATQNSRMFAGETTQADVELHAEEWIRANREIFDSWISQALVVVG
jgi:glycine betaine/proline transport system substrate-binding protein